MGYPSPKTHTPLFSLLLKRKVNEQKREDKTNGALSRGVSPRLIVRREDSQMASSDEIFVVESQDGVVGVEELRVEDHLDPIFLSIEELNSAKLVQHRVVRIVGHVVSDDRGEGVSLERKDSSFEKHLVGWGKELIVREYFSSVFSAVPNPHIVVSLVGFCPSAHKSNDRKPTYPVYLAACSNSRFPTLFLISSTVSCNCLVTACPLRASIVYDWVGAGMMMKATTVVLDPASLSMWFKPSDTKQALRQTHFHGEQKKGRNERANPSMNMSTPLFLYSYRPAVNK